MYMELLFRAYIALYKDCTCIQGLYSELILLYIKIVHAYGATIQSYCFILRFTCILGLYLELILLYIKIVHVYGASIQRLYCFILRLYMHMGPLFRAIALY